MSSRVLPPGGAEHVRPLVWREARPAASPSPAPSAPAVSARGIEAQIAQIEQQWQVRVRDAHAAGLREGEAAGRTRGAAEVQPAVERFARAAAELAQMRARLRKEAEADTLRLAMAIARRVLRRELAVDPEALQGLLLSALERLQAHEISRVRVHPSHSAMVADCLRKAANGDVVEVIADPSREPGDAIFETHRGNLDVSVESQLQEIERGLADRLRKHS